MSTSCKDIANDVLERCVSGKPPKELPRALVEDPCSQALFRVLVEGLGDRFEPSLCDAYARLFSQAVAHVTREWEPASLVARYERVRRPRPVLYKPHTIFVLSRVTLGADVAVTSVLMAAAKRRFPHARVVFVGPAKNYEMFAGDPHIHHAPINYRRGTLRERFAIWEELKAVVAAPDSIVIDPDSRLTQLGLLPICAEDRYHLFESRAYGYPGDGALSELAAAWAAETLGVTGARPFVSLGRRLHAAGNTPPSIAVSLGVGENHAKRVPDPFEEKLLALLASTGAAICVDTGDGGEESERVRRAVQNSGAKCALWQGSFAGFASIIAGSRLYVGYDSAGQHVAAACGNPLICVFTGFPVPRMFDRWRPVGERAHVIRLERPDGGDALRQVGDALSQAGMPARADLSQEPPSASPR
jgi:ADP-heptose:LPS heptosyltransferase